MNSAHTAQALAEAEPVAAPAKLRRAVEGENPTIFTDIFQEETNIAIWQRELAGEFTQAADEVVEAQPNLQLSFTAAPQDAQEAVKDALGTSQAVLVLSDDIALLVDMFCYLFELKRAGVRLTALDRAMCPRFHVDRVPCRLVTTYRGISTEWLPQHLVDRSKLGAGSQGRPDEQSGLFNSTGDIQQLCQGDVALLKGELWDGNEGAGLVHRSPAITQNQRRLLLTLDFIN